MASLLFLALLSSLLRHHAVAASRSCQFPAVFNFGDSNSDTGGLSAAFGQAPPPNGESFFGHPAGRYCDGRLIVDFIANGLGLPYLSAYLDSVGTNFSHGANFATAGSTIRPQNTTMWQSGFSPISLDVQTWEFSQFKSRSQSFLKRGLFEDQLPRKKYFSKGLYTFDIGQNDLTAAYFSGMATEQVKAVIPDVLDKFTVVVKSIYEEGGRFFWVHSTGPFGCLPYVLERLKPKASEVDRAGCGTPFNGVAQLFNKKLKETVDGLNKQLPLAVFTYVDIYSLKYELISQASLHGFEHPLVTCCGHGGKYNYNMELGCGSKMMENGTELVVKSCKHPERRIVWDGVHLTQAANKWIFEQFVDGKFSHPPASLRMACRRM